MYLWYLSLILFFGIIVKQNLFWLYLWQNKEYRGDKMVDYLKLPESKKIIFDYWTILRFLFLIILFLSAFFTENSITRTIITTSLIIANFLEIVKFLFDLYRRRVKFPKITAKAGLLTILSFLAIMVLLPFLWYSFVKNDLHDFSIAGLNLLSFFCTLIILLVPINIGYWILFLFPFDWYTKSQLFKKAAKYRQTIQNLNVVAISGAYGKTTTKEILDHVLSQKYKVEKTIKNQNSNVSCARRTLKLNLDTNYFLCELGAYKRGDGNEICEFIAPNSSIVTGLNYQHFSFFGSEENIIKAESESIHFLKPGEIIIVNWSSPLCHKIDFPKQAKVIKCAVETNDKISNGEFNNDVNYLAKNIEINFQGTTFDLVINGQDTYYLETNLISKGNIQNILHAIAYVRENNLFTVEEVSEIILNLPDIEGRLQIFDKKWGRLLYNQYNNEDGIINALSLLENYKGKKVIFIDDIMELGSKSNEIHEKLSKSIFETNPTQIILLGRSFNKLLESKLIEYGFEKSNIFSWNGKNTRQIKAEVASKLTGQDNLVLLLGYQSKNFLEL